MTRQLQIIPLTDQRLDFAGAVSLEVDGDGAVTPWRIPWQDRELYHPLLQRVAAMTAGVRLSFISDTTTIELDAEMRTDPQLQLDEPMHLAPFDLMIDGERAGRINADVTAGPVRFDQLQTGEKQIELWLPQRYYPLRYTGLRLDAGASIRPLVDRRPRWLAYGSSITQCRQADGPLDAWPALIANRFGLNLTCLGYGGNCHLEPMVARLIRDTPADYISTCLGINVHGGSLGERTFREAVVGLLALIREKHPRTPLVCVSPIFSPDREANRPNPGGLTLQEMRQAIAGTIDLLRARGDRNLYHVNGLDLFGEADLALMPDRLHPSHEGYALVAKRYAEKVMPLFGLTPARG